MATTDYSALATANTKEFLETAKNAADWAFSQEKLGVKVRSQIIYLVEVYEKTHSSGISLIKGEGVINAPAEKIAEFLSTLENRGKWDTFFDSGKIVLEVEKQKVVNSIGPISLVGSRLLQNKIKHDCLVSRFLCPCCETRC
jgi:hypothetical protein